MNSNELKLALMELKYPGVVRSIGDLKLLGEIKVVGKIANI